MQVINSECVESIPEGVRDRAFHPRIPDDFFQTTYFIRRVHAKCSAHTSVSIGFTGIGRVIHRGNFLVYPNDPKLRICTSHLHGSDRRYTDGNLPVCLNVDTSSVRRVSPTQASYERFQGVFHGNPAGYPGED